MSRIRSGNTKPEKVVRSVLHSLGFRFRLHQSELPGRPDIVLRRIRTAIFVHGCFWHRHKGCKFAYTPKSREEFWGLKFRTNVLRDRRVSRQLKKSDWNVVVVWECKTRDLLLLRKILWEKLKPMRDRRHDSASRTGKK